MADIATPQEPDDSRAVARGVDADGKLVFRQVGFEELNFGAVFGGKTTSTTENTVGYGLKTFTLDEDSGKILAGHTVQITSLDDVDCFMYGVVLRKDTAATPATIVVSIHTVSETTLTGSNWEIQIVEVSREVTLEVGDEDVTLEDHHRVVFFTEGLTAPRTLTLSNGETLTPGTRILICDASSGGAFTTANSAIVYDPIMANWIASLSTAGDFAELIWTGFAWNAISDKGFFYGTEGNSFPLQVVEYDDTPTGGPFLLITKNSQNPAAGDVLGGMQFVGMNPAAEALTYAGLGATLSLESVGNEYGAFYFFTRQAGASFDEMFMGGGVWGAGATGFGKGQGTFNAKGYFLDGVNINTIYQPKDATLTALAAYNTNGIVCQTAIDTFSGRTITGPAAGISVTNGNGVSGNPTLALAHDLSALEGLGGTGIAVRTAADTWAQRSIAAGQNISITNGDGVAGNPTIAVDKVLDAGTYTPSPFTNINQAVAPVPGVCEYLRIGNVVYVSGKATVDVTTAAGTASSFNIDLPIAPTNTFGSALQAHGVVTGQGTTASVGNITSVSGIRRVKIEWYANNAAANELYFMFTYQMV